MLNILRHLVGFSITAGALLLALQLLTTAEPLGSVKILNHGLAVQSTDIDNQLEN